MNRESASLGPSIWAVSDGRAGNASQVRAIVGALTDTRRWMQIAHIKGDGHRPDPIVLEPRAPWTWLPHTNWPFLKHSLPNAQRDVLSSPWPSVWIAAGRRSAPYTETIRRLSEGRTYCVQILDPRSDPEAFDLIVTPEHDALTGKNVLNTVGSPSHFSEDAIEEAGLAFADLADRRDKSAIVILGGDSKTYTFSKTKAEEIGHALETLAGQGWRLRITTSRRTPVEATAKMRQLADRIGARFWAGAEDGPNPYLGWLLYSQTALVTEDSANMLSDAAWHGLPVHILRLDGRSDKFDRLHKSLIGRGCARWFEGHLDTWDYAPLREASRVADRIVADLLARHPQPAIKATSENHTPPPNWMS